MIGGRMAKDQTIGAAILAGSIAGIVVYFFLVFEPRFLGWPWATSMITLQITAFVAVAGILAILAWIGYTLATTPAPEAIPELEEEKPEVTATESTETKPEEKPEEKKEEKKET